MIRAYDADLFDTASKDRGSLLDYISSTTVAAESAEVKAHVAGFLTHCRPAPQVREVLARVIDDERLLAKTRLVSDRSWRNCVLLVTPRRAVVTQGGITYANGTFDLDATLTYWRLHAETIFIHVSEVDIETPERTLGESMEYLLYWLFKRYFGTVTS